MANNQNVNKVVYDGNTLMDITDTTAEASDVAEGKYFYSASGAKTLGTAVAGTVDQTFDPTSPNAISGVGVNSAVGTGLSVNNNKINHSNSVTAQTTQALYPIEIDAQGHISAYGSAVTVPPAVAVKGNAEASYRTGNVNLTPANIGASASTHTHGSITNAGAITSGTALASGDAIVFADSSASNVLKKSSITFDGSTTTNYLSQKGTWVAVPTISSSALWTNSSPSSDFAGQKVSISSLNTYKLIIIQTIGSAGAIASQQMSSFVGIYNTSQFRIYNGRARNVTMSTTGITFSDGIGSAGTPDSSYNGGCIPYRIIGVKQFKN